jgi:hypothetical protein
MDYIDTIDSDTIYSDTIDNDTIDNDTIDSDTIDSDTIDSDTIDSDIIDSDIIDSDIVDLFRLLSIYSYKNLIDCLTIIFIECKFKQNLNYDNEKRCIRVAFRNEKPGWKWMQTNIVLPPNKYSSHPLPSPFLRITIEREA